MNGGEYTIEWAIELARQAFLVSPISMIGGAYVAWVFARHPDLTPVTEEM